MSCIVESVVEGLVGPSVAAMDVRCGEGEAGMRGVDWVY